MSLIFIEDHTNSYRDNYGMIELLLDNGADPNIPDKWGFIPLFRAIVYCHVDIVRLLLNHNSNIHSICNKGFNLSATLQPNADILDILNIFLILLILIVKLSDGQTPLHFAMKYYHLSRNSSFINNDYRRTQ